MKFLGEARSGGNKVKKTTPDRKKSFSMPSGRKGGRILFL